MSQNASNRAAEETLRRLYVYNGGFLTQKRIRRILALAGCDIRIGTPSDGDAVGIWGQSPTAPRGEKVSELTDAPIVRVEDAFLRSVLTGRDGEDPIGLHIDNQGVHFDPSTPSDLETLLLEEPLDDTVLLNRAKGAIAQLQRVHLSKYNAFDLSLEQPEPGYVLVIDQTRGDASVKASGCDLNSFREMLYYAQEEHPGARIIIKTHPETEAGHRGGYFTEDDCNDRISLCTDPYSPYALFEGAIAVYTVSSQLGFEAILTGHKPVVFGQPFYMGWGLTDDRKPLTRRQRNLTRAQLFAAAMILYPKWYDPFRDRLCELEDLIAILEAQAKAWRDDHKGWVATGMRLWKRPHLQKFFGGSKAMKFAEGAKAKSAAKARNHMVWAGKVTADMTDAVCVEDGFLRSSGLGASLVPPLSLVLDDLGIYYDPSRPSRLEALIEASTRLPETALLRSEKLITALTKHRLSKYNLAGSEITALPNGRRILVPGQVEDDASILKGAEDIRTNRDLLIAVRNANPAAVLAYKPHPDVEAGLRSGAVPDAEDIADIVLTNTDPISAIEAVDEVWTITSLMGFEALLRGKRVTCMGNPFYAGWGLTDDRAKPIPRRSALPDLRALVHATLIDYPRYRDPVTGEPCPVEVMVDRLANGEIPTPGPLNRSLSKLQGVFASYAHLWR